MFHNTITKNIMPNTSAKLVIYSEPCNYNCIFNTTLTQWHTYVSVLLRCSLESLVEFPSEPSTTVPFSVAHLPYIPAYESEFPCRAAAWSVPVESVTVLVHLWHTPTSKAVGFLDAVVTASWQYASRSYCHSPIRRCPYEVYYLPPEGHGRV